MSGIGGKLLAVAIRQIAKPISLTVKAQAIQHPRFRKGCIYIAQRLHTIDIRLRMSLLGQKNVKVRPLNDRKAIEDGATFLAESFVFAVGGSIIIYETYKTRKKQTQRTEAIEDDIRALQDEIEYMRKKLNEHNLKLDDYTLPKDLKPLILKLPNGEPPVEEQSEKDREHQKLQKQIEALEKKYGKLLSEGLSLEEHKFRSSEKV